MTAIGMRTVGAGGADPLRQVVVVALALYLVPVALVVLLIGAVGMACCGLVRLAGRWPRRAAARPRVDAATQSVRVPHFREASRARSSNR